MRLISVVRKLQQALAILCGVCAFTFIHYQAKLPCRLPNSGALSPGSPRGEKSPPSRGIASRFCHTSGELVALDIGLVSLPSFSYDRRVYIISTALSIRHGYVAILVAVPIDNQLHDSYPKVAKSKLATYKFYCVFGEDTNQVLGVLHSDISHASVVLCKIPPPALDCIKQFNRRSMLDGQFVPQCLVVGLSASQKDTNAVLLAKLKICQLEKPRQDFLVMCSQPITEEVWQHLPQWVVYHSWVGIEHFYLYSATGSKDGLKAVLGPSIQSDLVTVKAWMSQDWLGREVHFRQITAQNDCLYSLKDHAEWIAFFDFDEYLFPSPTFRDLRKVVRRHGQQVIISIDSFNFQMLNETGGHHLVIGSVTREIRPDELRKKYICNVEKTLLATVHFLELPRLNPTPINVSELNIHHYRKRIGSKVVTDKSLLEFAGAPLHKRLLQSYGTLDIIPP